MRGTKVDIRAYKAKGETKKRFNGFSHSETLLTHYSHLKEDAKKIAKTYFKENIHAENGFAGLKIEEAIQEYLFEIKANVPYPGPEKGKGKFTFIDLFAGIGGFRMALQNLGGECVFSSEWDKYAQQTYNANYGDIPFGDITLKETKKQIPVHFDLLCGGFPCQPFSIAGVTKKNSLGRKHGFDDEKQGNLFFHIEEIIHNHKPKAFFLENVKNLISHDKGNTFKIIKARLSEKYSFNYRVLDGKHFVPQHRERTIMVGFKKDLFGKDFEFDFDKIKIPEANHKLKDILETNPDSKYTLSNHLWNYLQEYAKKHKAKGNGFGFGLADLNGITRTMSARYYKDGAEILIPQKNKTTPRRLTIRESARLQGYPDSFIVDKVSMNQAYKQFGNSVVVPMIQAVGKRIVEVLETKER